MTQAQFMYELMKALDSFPDEEKYVIMNEYNQYFYNKKDSGMSEKEIIEQLPTPTSAAEGYIQGKPFELEGVQSVEHVSFSGRVTAVSVILFILLIPVCAVYEVLAVGLGLTAAVLMLALCIVAAFASVACFGVSGLSCGFILMGIGVLFATFALVLLSVAIFKGLAAAVAWFPGFMYRVLKNIRTEGGAQ